MLIQKLRPFSALRRPEPQNRSNSSPASKEAVSGDSFEPLAYDQPPMDELFKDGSPQWGKKYDKYISSTQVPHNTTEAEYLDKELDAKMAKEYYGDLENLSGSERMEALQKLVQGSHTPEPNGYHYVVAKHLYNTVDRHPDGTVRSVYSREPIELHTYPEISLDELSENELCSIAGACSSAPEVMAAWLAFQNGRAELNCEHTVPQSYFGKQEPMRSDLHHLYSCDIGENSRRGAKKYGSFKQPGGRGEVARATLYFMLRYPDVKLRYNSKDVQMLKEWSEADPPSLHEQRRNHEIQKIQGNRNPFIDHPEWAQDFRP